MHTMIGRNATRTKHDETTRQNSLCLGQLAQPTDGTVARRSDKSSFSIFVTHLRTVAAAVVVVAEVDAQAVLAWVQEASRVIGTKHA